MTNRKTGLIGGTFNPVHYGHLFLAEQAMEYCHLDQVLFIPSGISYMKNVREIASAEDRLQMVRLATENHPDFHVSSVETDRPGESYTCETLLTLSREYADTRFYFIIGADNLFLLKSGKNLQKSSEDVHWSRHFAVMKPEVHWKKKQKSCIINIRQKLFFCQSAG